MFLFLQTIPFFALQTANSVIGVFGCGLFIDNIRGKGFDINVSCVRYVMGLMFFFAKEKAVRGVGGEVCLRVRVLVGLYVMGCNGMWQKVQR